ncbi:MAG: polysaccharide biosynthesis C-terminal domain-containing protein, partial [Acholeplasmatales bacterium]|nr:polysaccharide biosynthesis C-terminal domain-containing protein [Acholeplasmatales bacterium]
FNAIYSIIKSSIPFGVVTLFFTFYTFVDSMTLSIIGIKGDIYTAYMFEAIRIIFLPITLAQSLVGILNPKINELVKGDKILETKEAVKKSTNGVIYILVPLIFVIKLYAKDIYQAFYEGSNNYMVLYHLSDLILYIGFYKVLIGILNALPKFTYIIWATFISIASKLILNFILGTRLGYLGALYATIISIGICIIIGYYILYKAKINILYDNLKSLCTSFILGFIAYIISILFRAIFIYGNFSFIWELILFNIVFLSIYTLFVVFIWFVKITVLRGYAYNNLGRDEK